MPRKPLIRSNHLPYHITQRSNNQEWFYLPISELWDICTKAIEEARKRYKVQIHAFVLMNNHYHSLVTTPLENLDLFQWRFANNFTNEVQKRTGRINHIFGCRYKWSIIDSQNYFYQAYKYIYLNPVRAGIVKKTQSYPYSTLYSKNIEVQDPFVDDFSEKDILEWINDDFSSEQLRALRKGFRRREFRIKADPTSRICPTYFEPQSK